jgi:hypothetical protein
LSSSSALICFFIPSPIKTCREVEIAAGVGVALIVEGAFVELVVVNLQVAEVAAAAVLHPGNRAGTSSILCSATLTHVLPASLQRANPLLLMLALLTRPRID